MSYGSNWTDCLCSQAKDLKGYGLVNGTKAFNAPLQAGWCDFGAVFFFNRRFLVIFGDFPFVLGSFSVGNGTGRA